ncbi:MAG: hypothetical protein JXO72_00800 [Vicinamibacteria bacterium]|nr:hypothetical protein [Vicinamibacteria bacterium]
MGRDRAKTFADRLAPVVPRVEEDVSHLSDELVDVLYPGRRPRPFRIGLIFDRFEGPNYSRALDLARQSSAYCEIREGTRLRHQAAFASNEAGVLRDLFEIVGPITGTDVTVNCKSLPYARELWMPLFWIFISGGES